MFQDVGTSVFLCDFHREQAWERWTKKSEHGLTTENRDTLLHLLRSMAHAPRGQDPETPFVNVEAAKAQLLNSHVYRGNAQVQSWLQGTWFPEEKRWARAYRENKIDMKINTNNGIEAQNKVFKYNYLSKGTDKTLSGVVKVIVEHFCPEQYKLYILKNLKLKKNIKSYNKEIPEYLHGRPHAFISHCLHRLQSSAVYFEKDIEDLGDLKFNVKSERLNCSYHVDLSSPSCSCPDWKKYKSPCKHMFAVFENTKFDWYSLPKSYRESSVFSADSDVYNDHVQDMEVDHDHKVGKTADQENKENEAPSVAELPHHKSKTIQDPVKHAANITRGTLQQLRELTYLSQNTEVLTEVANDLKDLVTKLSATVPRSSEGLYLRSSPTKVKKNAKQGKKSIDKKKQENMLNTIGSMPKKKKSGKKRSDWRHRNRVGKRANMLKNMYKVHVPVSASSNTLYEGNGDTQDSYFDMYTTVKTGINWKAMYKDLLTPTELKCLDPGKLINDLVIEAFFQ